MKWIDKYFEDKDDFPRPDWTAIGNYVEQNLTESDQHTLWCDIATIWVNKIKSKLPEKFKVYESDNFIILTDESERYASNFLSFLERTRKRILTTLQGIASDEGYGKLVVLIFEDIDKYYSYTSYFYPNDGEYGLSSGVYLNSGYGHFAFPHVDLSYAEVVSAHEMTHALLAHIPIPTWLNEGIAVTIEKMIASYEPSEIEAEMYKEHFNFWNEDEIQEFWSGDSFGRTDEAQKLSYHLAFLAVKSLSVDYDTFIKFVNRAHHSDGGEQAAQEFYSGTLGNLISQFFGERNWSPEPKKWKEKSSNKPLLTKVKIYA